MVLVSASLCRLVEGARKQRLAARVLFLVELHYTYLDLRTSTWGSGLYAHDKSLLPVFIDLIVSACFLYLSLVPARVAVEPTSAPQVR